jgi:dTDP-4-amino-4,6-dideoxygalactose transaminase
VNEAARHYTDRLKDYVKTPVIPDGFGSSWAQYTIQLHDEQQRNRVQQTLKEAGIPTMVYYPKPMHQQTAFASIQPSMTGIQCPTASRLCSTVLSLPMHPYLESSTIEQISTALIASL